VELGITAVELLPVFEYDELEFQRSPNPRDHMVNIWGYSHLSFFSPMSRFGSGGKGPAAAAKEFKQLVKALHGAGIEVILDVVYNHTVEGAPQTHQFAFCALRRPCTSLWQCCKETLHGAGVRAILDVVYNHNVEVAARAYVCRTLISAWVPAHCFGSACGWQSRPHESCN